MPLQDWTSNNRSGTLTVIGRYPALLRNLKPKPVSVCSYCKKVQTQPGIYTNIPWLPKNQRNTHGICPQCVETLTRSPS